ncbi:autotransporter outer membrane beta-barrel domain-containing protein, partial [Cysteiniphilum halobium]|uniref:hypothetical protein n=1 Tax=Cysteiniphilum halobium TaxID=2219059 RepID=UPI0013C3531D
IGTNNAINRPISNSQNVVVTLKNIGKLNWLPSTMIDNYIVALQGQSVNASNVNILGALNGSSCLNTTTISPNNSCNVVFQINHNTDTGNYAFLVSPDNNLQTLQRNNFSIAGSLGQLQFLNSNMNELTNLPLNIGDASKTVSIKNIGETALSNLSISFPNNLTIANNTCSSSLSAGQSCTFAASVANAVGSFNAVISVTANTADSSSVAYALSVNAVGTDVTISSINSIPQPNVDTTITQVELTNISPLSWQPSTVGSSYQIIGNNTTGISVVDAGVGSYCLNGNAVAQNESCTLGIAVSDVAQVGNYSLQLNLANNLAEVVTQGFSITSSLGYATFSPSTITLAKSSAPEPEFLTITNVGDLDITNFYVDETALNSVGIVIQDSSCGNLANTITLQSGATCDLEILANNAVVDGTYQLTVYGDSQTLENNGAMLPVTIEDVAVGIS